MSAWVIQSCGRRTMHRDCVLEDHSGYGCRPVEHFWAVMQAPGRLLCYDHEPPVMLLAEVCSFLFSSIILRQDPLEAILVIFGRRALPFFVWKLLEKNEKWHHFCPHAQWWSPWSRKNVEKGRLALSNLTFLLIAIDTNGFRRMKEEEQIYKICLIFFNFCPGT